MAHSTWSSFGHVRENAGCRPSVTSHQHRPREKAWYARNQMRTNFSLLKIIIVHVVPCVYNHETVLIYLKSHYFIEIVDSWKIHADFVV
jgi:hypothetical protein